MRFSFWPPTESKILQRRNGPISAAATILLVAGVSVASAQEPATHNFEEVAEGVFFATDAGQVYLMSNALVIVNEEDVVVVDSHVTPAAARALIESIEGLTDKPIRYLINTHYHFDHAHGNQAFGDDVTVVGHDYTYEKLAGDPLSERTFVSFSASFETRLTGLEERLAAEESVEGRQRLEQQIRVLANHIRDSEEIVPRPPDVTLDQTLTLFLGGRVIELHHFGRSHTGGDVVVFLPAEKLVFTGDLLLPFLSYMGDGYVEEWDETLEKLKSLDFELMLPGHGQPFRDRARIDRFQAYLRDLWTRVAELREQGISAVEAAIRVDLTNHREAYGVSEPGADVRAVERIYALLDEGDRAKTP